MWLGSRSVDVKNAHPHTGIDLMHGWKFIQEEEILL
jgi:uncharacterized protein YlzI (FlbEa/FlbD family)